MKSRALTVPTALNLAITFAAACSLFASTSLAVDATLTWDAPTQNEDGTPLTDLAGYNVYYGTTSGSYSEVTNVGAQTTHVFTGLQTGQYHYFSTTAYDTSGNESAFSEELQWSSTPPVANDNSYSVQEDGSRSRSAGNGVLANDTDFENDTLTAVLVDDVANGTLTLSDNGSFTYTPDANFNGEDTFTYRADDGSAQSALATVTFTVTAVNDAPEGDDLTETTAEDTSLDITLSGTDIDGDTLTYTVVSGPTHGTLSGSAPNLAYTPDPDYHGADSLSYRVNDGTVDSPLATVDITVTPVNDPPEAQDINDTTLEDQALSVTLSGSDTDGDSLTYSIVSGPSNGALSGTTPNLVYTPASNYSGNDSFTYRVNDGTVNSAVATVSITVVEVDDTPPAPPTNLRAQIQ